MSRRPLFTLAVLALLAACGGESSRADAAGEMSEAATEARTATSDDPSAADDASSSGAPPASASYDRCAEARFEDAEPRPRPREHRRRELSGDPLESIADRS